MGSSLGLREILRASFPEKSIYSVGGKKADYLEFIGSEDEEPSEEVYKRSLLIAVDTATFGRIDNNHATLCPEIIKLTTICRWTIMVTSIMSGKICPPPVQSLSTYIIPSGRNWL